MIILCLMNFPGGKLILPTPLLMTKMILMSVAESSRAAIGESMAESIHEPRRERKRSQKRGRKPKLLGK